MSIFDFSAPHPEASKLTAFSANDLDRQSENRPEGILQEAMSHQDARYLAFGAGDVLLKQANALLSSDDIKDLSPDFENAILLGWDAQKTPTIAVTIDINEEQLKSGDRIMSPRDIYAEGLMSDSVLGELAQGASLISWVKSNRFCGVCGHKTEPKAGGYNRHCPSCERTHFPRTDPVVIMLVIDEENDRCLLGRSPHFGPNMYSALAGFVEPGETIEDAVRRETFEEAGIPVGHVRYHASQPWPMPHTLMIGCMAQALKTKINFDSEELADCRWFNKQEVTNRLTSFEGEDRMSPPEGAIAHRLMRDWLDWS